MDLYPHSSKILYCYMPQTMIYFQVKKSPREGI
uniref:Uncharacterized protein n=1 Tax=Siphoviridae sp. ctnPP24 TaxID=2825662 RepID=A0A8S5TZA5_9CAUD|nr:MAG TPA: hypothetical protein [Siphoviridae sp. ctnPP24]